MNNEVEFYNEFNEIEKETLKHQREVILERKDQERKLTGILNQNKERVSILVTGMRGAGKTTLIEECLKKDEEDTVSKIFKKNNGGVNIPTFAYLLASLFIKIFLLVYIFQEISSLLSTPSVSNETPLSSYSFILLSLILTSLFLTNIRNGSKNELIWYLPTLSLLFSSQSPLTISTIALLILFNVFSDDYFHLIPLLITFSFTFILFIFEKKGTPQPATRSILAYWSPFIKVKCNLGFEKINHETILRAMIVGLIQEYKNKLFSIKSSRFWIRMLWPISISIVITNIFQPQLLELLSESEYSPDLTYTIVKSVTLHNERLNKIKGEKEINKILFSPEEINIIKSADFRSDGAAMAIRIIKNKVTKISEIHSSNSLRNSDDYLAFTNQKHKTINGIYEIPMKSENCTKDISQISRCLTTFLKKIKEEHSIIDKIFSTPFFHSENTNHIPLTNRLIYKSCGYENCGYVTFNLSWVAIFLVSLFTLYKISNKLNGASKTLSTLNQLATKLDPENSNSSKLKYNFSFLSGLTISSDENHGSNSIPTSTESIEVRFKLLLREISRRELSYFRLLRKIKPKRSITFILDELDKLETNRRFIEPESDRDRKIGEALRTENTKREILVESILAEMKDIISSSNARFIVVGGRETRDRWLADQTDRHPLLASIFEHCIYIPSLLVDENKIAKPISQYLFGVTGRTPPEELKDSCYPNITNFLAYRSRGNPKKLSELVSSFYQQNEQTPLKNTTFYFNKMDRMAIQLISGLFSKILNGFSTELKYRDDKVLTAIFYLSDFIIKFHQRAFSWNSLEKIDELSDIHRAPDIREVLEQIVVTYQDLILHKVRNGMYSFRFRSEFLSEVEYLSRNNQAEMAAFNFTLDESYNVKSLYLQKLNNKVNDHDNISIILTLAELHEFDKQFDLARKEYSKALEYMYAKYKEREVIDSYSPSDQFTLLITMLKIGMTYELSRDFGQALTTYQKCEEITFKVLKKIKISINSSASLIKNLPEIIQPIFMTAWILEKIHASVDTSTAHLERKLSELKKILNVNIKTRNDFHFRDESIINITKWKEVTPQKTYEANTLLVAADMHNKTGDLYFFKGVSIDEIACESLPGYMIRSRHHYLESLTYLQIYFHYRNQTSKNRFSSKEYLTTSCYEGNYFSDEKSPLFPSQSLTNVMLDLGESFLAGVSLKRLLEDDLSIYKNINVQYLLEDDSKSIELIIKESLSKESEIRKSIVNLFGINDNSNELNQLLNYVKLTNRASYITYKDGAIETNRRESVRMVESLLQIALEYCLLKALFMSKDDLTVKEKSSQPFKDYQFDDRKILLLIEISITHLNKLFSWDEYYAKTIGEKAISRYYLSMMRCTFLTLLVINNLKLKDKTIEPHLEVLFNNLINNLTDKSIVGNKKENYKKPRKSEVIKTINEIKEKLTEKKTTKTLIDLTSNYASLFYFPFSIKLRMDYYCFLFDTIDEVRSSRSYNLINSIIKKTEELDELASSLKNIAAKGNEIQAQKTLIKDLATELNRYPIENLWGTIANKTKGLIVELGKISQIISVAPQNIGSDVLDKLKKLTTETLTSAQELKKALDKYEYIEAKMRNTEEEKSDKLKRCNDLYKKLDKLKHDARSFGDPLQFPHYKVGICQYLFSVICKDIKCEKITPGKKINITKSAQISIRKSLSLCTMGDEYYNKIMGSYYAYDDFNDRHLHFQYTQTIRLTSLMLRIDRMLIHRLNDYEDS